MVKFAGYKTIAFFVILIMTFLASYSPVWIKKFRTNKTLIALANTFSGGVFLSVGLIHIIPDALDKWEDATKKKGDDKDKDDDGGESFPYVTLLVLISFSFILLVDRVLLAGLHSHDIEELDKEESNSIKEEMIQNGAETVISVRLALFRKKSRKSLQLRTTQTEF